MKYTNVGKNMTKAATGKGVTPQAHTLLALCNFTVRNLIIIRYKCNFYYETLNVSTNTLPHSALEKLSKAVLEAS